MTRVTTATSCTELLRPVCRREACKSYHFSATREARHADAMRLGEKGLALLKAGGTLPQDQALVLVTGHLRAFGLIRALLLLLEACLRVETRALERALLQRTRLLPPIFTRDRSGRQPQPRFQRRLLLVAQRGDLAPQPAEPAIPSCWTGAPRPND